MRLFTAIDLPQPMKERLSSICFGIPRVRWSNSDQFHLTLAFIGDANPSELEDIHAALSEITFKPIEIHCQGIGSFRNGTLWLGVENTPALERLQQQVRQKLQRIAGVTLDHHRFRPHITLGKMDPQNPPKLETFLTLNNADRYSFTAHGFQLKSSQLSPKGAIHGLLEEYPPLESMVTPPSNRQKEAANMDHSQKNTLSIREQLRLGKVS